MGGIVSKKQHYDISPLIADLSNSPSDLSSSLISLNNIIYNQNNTPGTNNWVHTISRNFLSIYPANIITQSISNEPRDNPRTTSTDVTAVRIGKLAVPRCGKHPFSDFKTVKTLGKGSKSTVFKCTSVYDPQFNVAMKEVSLANMTKSQRWDLQMEMNILSQLNHPNIVKLLFVYDTTDTVFLMTEYLRGGELIKAIGRRAHYDERDAQRVIFQITDAVAYIHSKGIVHRDLKPQNIILETTDFSSNVKLVDFGLAVVLDDFLNQFKEKPIRRSTLGSTQVKKKKKVQGTPNYMPPEVLLHAEYSKAADMWSLGVIIYVLLSGSLPFDITKNDSLVYHHVDFSNSIWDVVSEDAKHLISSLLNVNPSLRLTAEQVLQHSWLLSYKERISSALSPQHGDRQPVAAIEIGEICSDSMDDSSRYERTTNVAVAAEAKDIICTSEDNEIKLENVEDVYDNNDFRYDIAKECENNCEYDMVSHDESTSMNNSRAASGINLNATPQGILARQQLHKYTNS